MGLGEPIGYSARLTQNNGGLYQNQVNQNLRGIHIALMGDPTLRMHPVAPPSGLTANGVNLNWTASPDSVAGYHVYRAATAAGPFTRLTPSLLGGTSFSDLNALAGTSAYMVRAVKLENTPSGTYFNLSQGAYVNGSFSGNPTPIVTVTGPGPSATVSGAAVSVSASVLNIPSVAGVQFKLDGSNLGTQAGVAPYTTLWNSTKTGNGSHRLTAVAIDSLGVQTSSAELTVTVNNATVVNNNLPPNTTLWVEDALPAGAVPGSDGGDTWNWVSGPPAPFSGTVASQSSIGAGEHQHFFDWAANPLPVNAGDAVFAYVYLDPGNMPSEAMLQWNDGTWEHRAYWGANNIQEGVDGTVSRFYAGPLPQAGQWVRLEVRASQVGLQGSRLKGMAFTLFGGRATWDCAGKHPASGLSIKGVAQGIALSFPTVAGQTYQVQYKTSLLGTSWTDLNSSFVATNSITTVTDTVSKSVRQRFYRVKQ